MMTAQSFRVMDLLLSNVASSAFGILHGQAMNDPGGIEYEYAWMKSRVVRKTKRNRGAVQYTMSTYTQILYQIVFGTKHREPTLEAAGRPELFRYISGLLENKKCHVYQINGVADHLHILLALHPSVALSELVKDIKLSSTKLIKEKLLFPRFSGWQEGYGAFTYATDRKQTLINYIRNQEVHHRKKSFRDEYVELLDEHHVDFDEKYLL